VTDRATAAGRRDAEPAASAGGPAAGADPSLDGAAAGRERPAVTVRTAAHAWSLRRRLGYVSALVAALLIVGSVIGGLALNALIGAVDLQVNRLDPAARTTGYLTASLVDEETGVRGYVITGQGSYLRPYHLGVAQSARLVARLHRLIDSYPTLRADLHAVDTQASAWRTAYAEPAITAVESRHPPSATLEATGKSDFDRLRSDVSVLSRELMAERDAALDRLHSAVTQMIIVAIVGGVLLVLGAIAAWAGLNSWVTRPLAALGGEVRVVASGDVDHQVEAGGPREVVELGADVEAMRRLLRSSLAGLSFKAGELERSNRELEQFAYVASHDLQEPLRKVASFCQMLESRYRGQLDERAQQYIAYAVDGAKRMQGLINDLLAFSRVGQGGAVRTEVSLTEAAQRAVDALDATIADTEAEVIIGDLPAVSGDQTLLTQLFQNLIANAIKFRRVDEPPVVRLTAERKDEMWEMACGDNGIGIAPAYAERVFVIFQRLHPREAYPGTGIGLALCRKIVEFHGGQIWVDTHDPTAAGTTIRWTLPATEQYWPDGERTVT
jgi:hypothetical protein